MAVQTLRSKIEEILGAEAAGAAAAPVQDHSPRTRCTCPARTIVERIHLAVEPPGCRCWTRCSRCSNHGRLGGTGYVSILPVDQGIEHSAGASFAPNPLYFDPENIVKLAIEGGCNAVASTLGVLGIVRAQVRAQDSVHREDQPQRVPLVSEHATTRSCSPACSQALRHGRAGVGATIYFGSEESKRQIQESLRDVPAGARARHVHGAVVLPAQPGVQDEGQRTTTSPPTSPARRITSA